MSFAKKELRSLIAVQGSQLWAFDCCVGTGAKCWVWSKDVESFMNTYLGISFLGCHAYETFPLNTACRMVYDLNMCMEDGLNVDKDHTLMVDHICEF